MAYRLQAVAGTAKANLTGLTSESTVADLQAAIAAALPAFPAGTQSLKIGFPPTPLPLDDPSATLASIGVTSGSRIAVSNLADEEKVPAGTVLKGTSDPDFIFTIPKTGSGRFVRREVPPDNSCLFHCIACTCANDTRKSKESAAAMRAIASQLVREDGGRRFNAEVLGQPPYSYCEMIMHPDVWGGAIELQVFAEHYRAEIISFDYKYLREDVFGQGRGFKKRCFLIYTGKHYDYLAFTASPGASESKDKVMFNTVDAFAWTKAREHVEYLHKEAVKEDSSLELQKEWRTERDKKRAATGYSLLAPDTSKPKLDGWSCSACTSVNKVEKSVCEVCGTPKGSSSAPSSKPSSGSSSSAASKPSPAPAARPASGWACPTCTFVNADSAGTCSMCSTSRAGGAPSSASAGQSGSSSGGIFGSLRDWYLGKDTPSGTGGAFISRPAPTELNWTCSECTFINDGKAGWCSACGLPKPL